MFIGSMLHGFLVRVHHQSVLDEQRRHLGPEVDALLVAPGEVGADAEVAVVVVSLAHPSSAFV